MRLIPMFGIPSTLDLDFFAARCRSTSRLEIRLELASGLAIGSTSRARSLIGISRGQPCGARRKSARRWASRSQRVVLVDDLEQVLGMSQINLC